MVTADPTAYKCNCSESGDDPERRERYGAQLHSPFCDVGKWERANGVHRCDDHPTYITWDGPLGHGWECGVCGRLLQVG